MEIRVPSLFYVTKRLSEYFPTLNYLSYILSVHIGLHQYKRSCGAASSDTLSSIGEKSDGYRNRLSVFSTEAKTNRPHFLSFMLWLYARATNMVTEALRLGDEIKIILRPEIFDGEAVMALVFGVAMVAISFIIYKLPISQMKSTSIS